MMRPPMMPPFGMHPMGQIGPMNHPPMMFMQPECMGEFKPADKEEFMKRAVAYIKLETELTPKFKEHMLKKFDADKDGMLSDEEIKTSVESHKKPEMRHKKHHGQKPEQKNCGSCEKCCK